jgi:hypothetical protein
MYGNETNSEFYGNVYYHSGASLFYFYAGFTHNVYIYNNDFQNDGTFGDYQPGWLAFEGTMTGEVANNIWENVNISGTCSICDYNYYNLSGNGSGQTGSVTYTLNDAADFVNQPNSSNPIAADFHLTATGAGAFVGGKTLPAPYNVDPDGNTRGSGGVWNIGAYQYVSGGGTPKPPTNLTAVAQ